MVTTGGEVKYDDDDDWLEQTNGGGPRFGVDARGLTLVVEGGTAFTLGPSSAKRTYSSLAKGMSNFNKQLCTKNILLTKFEVHHQ